MIGNNYSANAPYTLFQSLGVHHKCWYDVEVQLPAYVLQRLQMSGNFSGTSLNQWTERVGYYCNDVNVPASTVATSDVRVGGGDMVKVPYSKDYGSLIMRFYVDGGNQSDGGLILKGFRGWIDSIYSPTQRQLTYYNDYVSTIKVTMYTFSSTDNQRRKEIIGSVTFYEAYPANIENITLSGTSQNEPTDITVNFNYRYYTTDIAM